MPEPELLAVPNFSEGRDAGLIAELARALTPAGSGVRLLDEHFDSDHNRSVFTVVGGPQRICEALYAGAGRALARIDVIGRAPAEAGQHPHVGALDVAPIVYINERDRGAACAEALLLADRLGSELAVPVFLYGELTADEERPAVSRASLRRGGVTGLQKRMQAGLRPDFGPARLHPSAGATLVAARPPLVAFNLQLAPPASVEDAREIAASIREGAADGLSGLRAIAVALAGGAAQVSMNVERPHETTLAHVVEAVAQQAPVASAELVGLAPAAALEGFPSDVPIVGFDPARHVIENALRS